MLNLWNNFFYPLLNSQATTSIIAIITALGVFIIYSLRRRDYKKDAANIILLEIKNAERNLEEARKSFEAGKTQNTKAITFPEKLRLMPTESWTKYKYLFVRDLQSEQWDEVSKFYDNCKNFDESVELKDGSFNHNAAEIRVNIHRIVADYAIELANRLDANVTDDLTIEKNNQAILEEIKVKKNAAVNAVISTLVEIYGPDKPFNDAAYFFSLLPRSIINTPTGEHLKSLADRRNIRIFRSR